MTSRAVQPKNSNLDLTLSLPQGRQEREPGVKVEDIEGSRALLRAPNTL